eukprot:403338712
MADEEVSAIVIDNGSSRLRIGYAGDEVPRLTVPTLIGRPKMNSVRMGIEQKEFYCCDEAVSKKGMLNMTSPIEKGIIKDWDDMERIWQHVLNEELKAQVEEHPVIMTEAPLNPKQYREKLTQLMFETFNVPCLYVSVQAVLSLYSSGRTSGLVLDTGDTISFTVPIHEGYAISHATQKVSLGGRDITKYLSEFVAQQNLNLNMASDVDTLRDIKEKLCYVVSNYEESSQEADQSHALDKTYDLPDGRKLTLGKQRFQIPEALFNPSLISMESDGLHKYAFDSILKCDVEARRDLYQNIIIAGGNSLFEGMGERLWQEMHLLAPSSQKIKVLAPPERKYSAWLGGAILSALSTFQTMWINKQEYDESGPSIIHRKCF